MPKHTVSVSKLLHLVENTMGTSIKFTELSIPYTEGEVSGIMYRGVFCTHKLCFRIPVHNYS